MRQRPALGGVGFGAVGVEAGQVVLHRPAAAAACWPVAAVVGQHRVDLGQVDALRGGRGQRARAGDRGDHGDLLGGHRPGGERRRHRGQLLQRPAGAHDLPAAAGRRAGSARAARRPSTSARRAPAPACSSALPHGAGQLGVDPVPGRAPARAVRSSSSPAGERVQVLGGERVQRRCQLAHDTSHTVRSGVRSLPRAGADHHTNPQVRGPIHRSTGRLASVACDA